MFENVLRVYTARSGLGILKICYELFTGDEYCGGGFVSNPCMLAQPVREIVQGEPFTLKTSVFFRSRLCPLDWKLSPLNGVDLKVVRRDLSDLIRV